jgi:hypothetical protein
MNGVPNNSPVSVNRINKVGALAAPKVQALSVSLIYQSHLIHSTDIAAGTGTTAAN